MALEIFLFKEIYLGNLKLLNNSLQSKQNNTAFNIRTYLWLRLIFFRESGFPK